MESQEEKMRIKNQKEDKKRVCMENLKTSATACPVISEYLFLIGADVGAQVRCYWELCLPHQPDE